MVKSVDEVAVEVEVYVEDEVLLEVEIVFVLVLGKGVS